MRSRAMRARMLLVAAGFLAGGCLVELILWVAGVSFPLPYEPDPYVGTRLQPGFSAWFTAEGRARVHVNDAGFRDRPHTVDRPPGAVRIAVLGDSFCEALQVAREDTFWSQLPPRLSGSAWAGDRAVEILNFGVSGHGTAQQLLMWRHYAAAYDPQLVLLAFFAGNDVRNNSRSLEPDTRRPFFDREDGRLVLDNTFRRHPDFLKAQRPLVRWKVRLMNHSRVLQLWNQWRTARESAAADGQPRHEAGLDDHVFREPAEGSRWEEAWQLTELLVEQLHVEVGRRGAELVIVTVPQAIEVHPDPEVRRQFAESLGVPGDLGYPERRIAAFAERLGVPIVALAEPMRAVAEREGIYLHGFDNTAPGVGHWNEAGHRLAAKLIAERVRTMDGPAAANAGIDRREIPSSAGKGNRRAAAN